MRAIRLRSPYAVIVLLVFQLFNRSLAQTPSLITQPVDDTQRVTLKGNVHPLARTEFDRGAAPADLEMDRMLLVLKRSPEQDAALRKLLDDQQDKHSPHYRKWLTPQEFGMQFGATGDDIEQVKGWLGLQGFRDIQVSKGRNVIEFSGTASQVQSALGVTIRKFVVAGQAHWANSNDPSIPAALSPVVEGVFTLHNFFKKPQSRVSQQPFTAKAVRQAHPEFTSSTGAHALAPADYYTIYNFNPLGSGGSHIALIGRSNIDPQDPLYFHYWMYDQATQWDVFVNGPDPGELGGADETEADLDITWASVVAPSDWVTLVVSESTATTDGVDLSEQYIIDNNYADVMSESFGDCEANYTSTEAAGIATLAQQAAAQGITYVVASGDSGSAGCDDPNKEKTAIHGLSVNVLASTPYTVAVGGTVFNENGHDSTYWSSTNASPTQESALSYIPEDVWNDSCTSCSTPNIWAGGGGASAFFTKPSWQSGVIGIPTDNKRYLPDVSLTAAPHDPYLICLQGSCVPNAQGGISFYGVSGTSASTPAFAGILALVANHAGTRLGAPNYVLYRLAAAENLTQCNASSSTTLPVSTCIFNDVTVGNNAVPGETGYGTSNAPYQSGKGYDLATGLGSVNPTNLINQWNTVTFSPTSTTFSISPTSFVHGSAVNVSGVVTPNSGSGTPTGTIWLIGPSGNIAGQGTVATLSLESAGTYSGVTHLLAGGSYQVHAHYAGDQTYAPSDSSPPVQVNIQPEPTSIAFSVSTKDSNGNLVPFTSGLYGTPIYYQAQLTWQSGYGAPSSYVLFWDNGPADATPDVNSKGYAISPALTINSGSHSITAGYYGDFSFGSSTNLTPINFTITQLSTTTTLTSQQTAQSLLLTATVSANGIGTPASGSITFSSGGNVLGVVPLTPGTTANGVTQATAAFDASQLTAGQYNVTASYAGDTNYTPSTSSLLSLNLVADFSITNQGITSQTVTAGQTAQYINDVVLMPFFGYNSTATVSCIVPARATTCSVSPNSYALASGRGIGTMAITTTARSAARVFTTPQPRVPLWGGALAVTFFIGFTIVVPRRRRAFGVPIFCVAALLLGIVACGGSGSDSGGGGGGGSGTPAGTYTVTVTGTAGPTTHTTTFTLIVQ